ncbi:MAG: polysaccharide deacetylase family protein [Gammaproteobacteria bacterium]|nr:polysaccharide deacetylase family protein [Gammaproteobacteria bacterium]
MKTPGRTLRRWFPSPLLRASVALHAAAGAALLARPRIWPIALGAVVADHLALTAAGLWPRSRLLGPNWTRLPAGAGLARSVAITIDDGPDPEVTPQVLEILDRYDVRASFFCIGARVERHPELVAEIARRGHSVENHGYRHAHSFALLGPRALREDLSRAQRCIHAAARSEPLFFRAPAGLRNPLLQPVLAELGLRLASWTRRGYDTVNRDPQRVLRRLTNRLGGAEILLLHDGHAARSTRSIPVVVEVLPALLDVLRTAGLTPVTLRAALANSGAR